MDRVRRVARERFDALVRLRSAAEPVPAIYEEQDCPALRPKHSLDGAHLCAHGTEQVARIFVGVLAQSTWRMDPAQ